MSDPCAGEGAAPLTAAFLPCSYCIGLFAAPLLQSFCENHQMYQLQIIGTRLRNAVMSAIYRKCLRLSNSSLQAESTGKVSRYE